VDYAVGGCDVNRRGVKDRRLIASGGERRVAFQGVEPAEQSEFDRISALTEQPRGGEAIAGVAAGATKNGDPAARLREPRRLVGDRETRPLHERDARHSGGNRKAVGFAHFGGREELRERQGIAHGTRKLRAVRALRKRQKRASHRAGFCYIPPTLIPDSSA